MNDQALNYVLLAFAFVIGASIGSFLNVVVYRVPNGMSVVKPPSQCPDCGHHIRPYDNVPIIAWLWLRGRCRDCGVRISPKYILAELGFGLFALSIAKGIIFHDKWEIFISEVAVGIIVTLVALLPPLIAGIRREMLDANDLRMVAAVEGKRLHHEDNGVVHAHGRLGNE